MCYRVLKICTRACWARYERTRDVAANVIGQADDRAASVAVPDGADVVQRADDAHLAARTEGIGG